MIYVGFICALTLNLAAGNRTGEKSSSEQTLNLSLESDLAIGVDDGDENFVFGKITRIALDGAENIYVLDYK